MTLSLEFTQDRLEKVYALVGNGQVALALRLLQALVPESGCPSSVAEGHVYEALTLVCALLGYIDEAQEALDAARKAPVDEGPTAHLEILRAFVAWIEGDSVVAINTATTILTLYRVQARQRNQTLAILAGAQLQLGHWERARESILAMDRAAGPTPDIGWLAGRWLWGEIQIWLALRRALRLPEGAGTARWHGGRRTSVRLLCAEAQRVYQELGRAARSCELMSRLAAAGEQVAAALASFSRRSPAGLESHLEWLYRSGMTPLHRGFRWTIGLLNASGGNLSLARAWLFPLTAEACSRPAAFHEIELVAAASQLLRTARAPSPAEASAVEFSADQIRLLTARRLVEEIDFEAAFAGRRARRNVCGNALIERVERHVRDTLSKPHSIAELATATGVSRRKLEISFRAATGKSPKQFITALRLIEARRKMNQGGMDARTNLHQIARDTGFVSYRRFSASFVATFGVTPVDALEDGRASNV